MLSTKSSPDLVVKHCMFAFHLQRNTCVNLDSVLSCQLGKVLESPDPQADLRIAISKKVPRFEKIIHEKQQHRSH
jgi:hypothetical protein